MPAETVEQTEIFAPETATDQFNAQSRAIGDEYAAASKRPSLSDTVREFTPQPAASPAPTGTGFRQAADAAMADYLQKNQKVADLSRQRAITAAPSVQAVQQAAVEPLPPPIAPAIPPPPPMKINDYMAPINGDSPEKSLIKLSAALGVIATGLTGLARGNARAALAAWEGSMKGWHEGQREAAEREFRQWQALTSALLKDYDVRRAAWQDTMQTAKFSFEQKAKLIEMDMLQHGYLIDAAKLEAEGAKFIVQEMDKREKQFAELQQRKEEIEWRRELALRTEQYREAKLKQHQEEIDLRKKQAADVVNALQPDDITALGQQWVMGKLPPGIARGKAGTTLMPKIIAAGMQWARERGIDPMAFQSVRADMETTQAALKKLRQTTVLSEAQAARFETHMESLVKMSEQVDRSGRPVFNRWLLMVQGKYGGDEQVAAYEAQALEVAMEYAKLTVGTAQGDAATREEARRVINTWLNHKQLKTVAETLKQNAHNNVANNRAQEQALLARLSAIGAGEAPPEPPKPVEAKAPPFEPKAGKLPEGMPPADKNKGRTVRDTVTGKRYTSDGSTWTESGQ